MEIAKETYRISQLMPSSEKYGLVTQMTRSAVSVSSNIAEGSSRTSDKEYARFLEIALGSLFELDTQLILINEAKMIKSDELRTVFDLIDEEGRMINTFLTKLKSDSSSQKTIANSQKQITNGQANNKLIELW